MLLRQTRRRLGTRGLDFPRSRDFSVKLFPGMWCVKVKIELRATPANIFQLRRDALRQVRGSVSQEDVLLRREPSARQIANCLSGPPCRVRREESEEKQDGSWLLGLRR